MTTKFVYNKYQASEYDSPDIIEAIAVAEIFRFAKMSMQIEKEKNDKLATSTGI